MHKFYDKAHKNKIYYKELEVWALADIYDHIKNIKKTY